MRTVLEGAHLVYFLTQLAVQPLNFGTHERNLPLILRNPPAGLLQLSSISLRIPLYHLNLTHLKLVLLDLPLELLILRDLNLQHPIQPINLQTKFPQSLLHLPIHITYFFMLIDVKV